MYRGLLAEKSAEVALYRDEVDELLGMTRMPTMGLPFVNLKTCALEVYLCSRVLHDLVSRFEAHVNDCYYNRT